MLHTLLHTAFFFAIFPVGNKFIMKYYTMLYAKREFSLSTISYVLYTLLFMTEETRSTTITASESNRIHRSRGSQTTHTLPFVPHHPVRSDRSTPMYMTKRDGRRVEIIRKNQTPFPPINNIWEMLVMVYQMGLL